jgi:hypothetical protein
MAEPTQTMEGADDVNLLTLHTALARRGTTRLDDPSFALDVERGQVTTPSLSPEDLSSDLRLDRQLSDADFPEFGAVLEHIAALLEDLATRLGETGQPAVIRIGSTVVEFAMDDRQSPALIYPAPHGSVSIELALTPGSAGDQRLRADGWATAMAAAREGDHRLALRSFEREAEAAAGEQLHQRAAIAYSSASREAAVMDEADLANKLLRLAGKHYIHVSEDPRTTARGQVQALTLAAGCFRHAGNRNLAEQCMTWALSGLEAIGGVDPSIVHSGENPPHH